MTSSITTFNGMKCTKILRTEYFTTISVSSATEMAGLSERLSSTSTSVTATAASQSSSSTSTSSIIALAGTLISTSSTISTSATVLPASSSSSSIDSSPKRDSNNDIIAAAVGASLGAVSVIALVILFAYFRRRKRYNSHNTDGEKLSNRRCGAAPLPSLAQVIQWLKQKTGENRRPRFIKQVQNAVVAAVWHRRSTTDDDTHGEDSAQTQPGTAENNIHVSFQFETQNRDISASQPAEMRQTINTSADPFSDANAVRHQSGRRSENPFIDPEGPSIWTDFSDDTSVFQPLTLRNLNLDGDFSADDHQKNAINDAKDNAANHEKASGSTLGLSTAHTSSSEVPDFKAGLENWRPDLRPKDRSSTYSDPFDLDRPLTIHSSGDPTPEAEQHYREGYFPEELQPR